GGTEPGRQQVVLVVAPVLGRGEPAPGDLAGLLRGLQLVAPYVGGQRQDVALVHVSQPGQLLGVAFLQRAEQCTAQGLYRRRVLLGLFQQVLEAVGRYGAAAANEDVFEAEAGGSRPDQQHGVDGGCEQRQLARDAVDVLTAAQLFQPVGDPVPAVEQAL